MSNFFLRETVLTIGGITLRYPELEIRFDIPFDELSKPNVGEIQVYNLSRQTLAQIKKGYPVILNSGYNGSLGTILGGEVISASTKVERVDRITTIKVSDSLEQWKTAKISKTYAAGTNAVYILNDLAKSMGMKIGEINPLKNPVYKRGRTVSGLIQQIIRDIAVKECGAKFHITNGRVFILPTSGGKQTAFVLNTATGLVGSPTEIEKEINGKKTIAYEVISLLNYQLYTDSIIQVQSSVITGFYRVRSGAFISDGSQHVTKMEVVPA